ncbi:MAG: hypothetical protein U0165_01615 [Polyangiaceae bacterium]
MKTATPFLPSLRLLALGGAVSTLALVMSACSANDKNADFGDNGGTSGSAGSAGAIAGSSGSAGTGGSSAGSAGSIAGGAAGSAGSIAGNSGSSGSSGSGGTGGGLQDAPPEAGDGGCVVDQQPPNGPLERTCAQPTNNECDGQHDINSALPNGQFGNGFDDDCDGKVDEGCPCNLPAGSTKECWLVPASQADPNTHEPVGFCNPNSKGTMTCVASGVEGQKSWDGFCKGAQFPYADDSCAPGDFDCDGVQQNPTTQCQCDQVQVTCPTEPVVIGPFPRTNDLTYNKANPSQPFIVDGYNWISGGDPAAVTTQWKWTVTGGDCDNILPHPTFAIYNGKDTGSASIVGTEYGGLGSNAQQRGWVTPVNDGAHQIFPAFSLSGDYTVQADFLLNGEPTTCVLKVQVRAPGLRAETCWDTVGNNDVDLHFARLQGTSGTHGFCDTNSTGDDCYYIPTKPNWGYTTSNDDACVGWGSKGSSPCNNPRLDRDNISCDTTVNDPSGGGGLFSDFCGPENINLDNPNPGDQFIVAVHAYGGTSAHPHVNIYCGGERKLSLGYDPVSSPSYPLLNNFGGYNCKGSFWIASRIVWNGENADPPCSIEPIPSNTPNSNDGSTSYCVDNNGTYSFHPNGSYPTSPGTAPAQICGH